PAARPAVPGGIRPADGRAAFPGRRQDQPRRFDGDPAAVLFQPAAGGRGADGRAPDAVGMAAADGRAPELPGDEAAGRLTHLGRTGIWPRLRSSVSLAVPRHTP